MLGDDGKPVFSARWRNKNAAAVPAHAVRDVPSPRLGNSTTTGFGKAWFDTTNRLIACTWSGAIPELDLHFGGLAMLAPTPD